MKEGRAVIHFNCSVLFCSVSVLMDIQRDEMRGNRNIEKLGYEYPSTPFAVYISLSVSSFCRYTTVMGSAGSPDSCECHVMVQHLSNTGLEGQWSLIASLHCNCCTAMPIFSCMLRTLTLTLLYFTLFLFHNPLAIQALTLVMLRLY